METRVSASTVSELNQKIYGNINEWRERPLVSEFPYVFLDGLWLKRSWCCAEWLSGGTESDRGSQGGQGQLDKPLA
jgi:hypothetical protein